MLINRIQLFVDVATHQSVAKVAQKTHVSPSSISQRLKALENDFGVKLYQRNRTGIELTPAGRMVLTTAGEVLQQIESLRNALKPDGEAAVRRLTVAATYNPSAKYLPSAIAAFQKRRPDVEVTFVTSYRRTVEKCVRDGEADIVLVQTPTDNSSPGLHFEHFATDLLAFFTHPGDPLARKQNVRLEDLADKPLVVRQGRGTTDKALDMLRARGLKFTVALRCATPDAVKAAVRRKMGTGILFRNMIEEDVRRREVKVLSIAGLPSLTAETYIIYSKIKPLTLPAAQFLEVLRNLNSKQKNSPDVRTARATAAQ